MKITSLQNPKVKEAVRLRKAGARREAGLVVIEGLREIQTAVGAGVAVDSLFVCPELAAGKSAADVKGVAPGAQYEVTESVFCKMAGRESPDGFLALACPKPIGLAAIKLSANPLVIVLEAVEKPGNLGAILRTADASGVDAVVVCDPQTDIFNPNVIRSSIGCVFTKQVAVCTSDEAMAWLKTKKIRILAATPHDAVPYTKIDMSGPCALVLGTEADGLSEEWLSLADARVGITMRGKADSLNVSTSCAVLVFEALRQREKVSARG